MLSKKKEIILFTNTFPYGSGDDFLIPELKIISPEFSLITIFPFQITKSVHRLPKNVIVDNSLISKRTKISLLTAFLSVLFSSDFYKEISKFGKKHFFFKIYQLIVIHTKSNFIKNVISTFIKDKKLDLKNTIFYTYWLTSATYALGEIKNTQPEMTLVSRIHGYDLYSSRYKSNYIPYHKESINAVDRLYCISQTGCDYLKNLYDSEIVNIDNKLSVSRLGIINNTKNITCSEDNSIFRILTCSSIIPVKRLDLLVDSLILLDCQHVRVEWHHIGEGRDRAIIEKKLEMRNNKFDVFFYGFIDNQNVMIIYKNCRFDLFINVSDSEGIPVSIMEAMSFGVPVMARNVGGLSEIVNDENGFLLNEIISPIELSKEITSVIMGRKTLASKGTKAYQSWCKKFNAEINYHGFARLLNNLF